MGYRSSSWIKGSLSLFLCLFWARLMFPPSIRATVKVPFFSSLSQGTRDRPKCMLDPNTLLPEWLPAQFNLYILYTRSFWAPWWSGFGRAQPHNSSKCPSNVDALRVEIFIRWNARASAYARGPAIDMLPSSTINLASKSRISKDNVPIMLCYPKSSSLSFRVPPNLF